MVSEFMERAGRPECPPCKDRTHRKLLDTCDKMEDSKPLILAIRLPEALGFSVTLGAVQAIYIHSVTGNSFALASLAVSPLDWYL
jgi:hypothetical protein